MSYRKGADAERDLRDDLERRGSVCIRAAGSKGKSGADLVELRPAGRPPRLIQCKKTKTMWSGFGPAERYKLLQAAAQVGAEAILAWTPPGTTKVVWVPPDCWPPTPYGPTIESVSS